MRALFFDAFATLIRPRKPVAQQYVEVFKPHFLVDEKALKDSFKYALKRYEAQKPPHLHHLGASSWWSDVICAAAIGAGADPSAVKKALPTVVPILMKRFSSREGYDTYPDVFDTLRSLRKRSTKLVVVSNSDSRVRLVLRDLGIEPLLDACVLSEEEGVAKPDPEIWRRAAVKAGLIPIESTRPIAPKKSIGQNLTWLGPKVIHIGDELVSDYHGARAAGLRALLVRRPGILGTEERKEEHEDLDGIQVIRSLAELVDME